MMVDEKVAFVVEESVNPSSDFFVIPELKRQGYMVRRCRFTDLPLPEELHNSSVVFVRYVPHSWKSLVNQCRDKIARIIYFMDDDLLSLTVLSGLPLRYQLKLIRYSLLSRGWLKKLDALFWVSTPYLQSRYSEFDPLLVSPVPVVSTNEDTLPVTFFYHGSASHVAELSWLFPVVDEVLRNRDNIVFEMIGSPEVNKKFRALPRVNLLQPMSWLSYQALLRRGGREIGLAPLLDVPFNRARSYTKFFDITAAGAAGIYADHSIYTSIVEHECNGLLMSQDQASWYEAILHLADNPQKRLDLLANAQLTNQQLCRK